MQKIKILLVIAIAQFGKITLERLGSQVTCAKNGNSALKMFAAAPGKFDLVVSDQIMPKMTDSAGSHRLFQG